MALTPRHRWCIDKIVQCFAHHEVVDDPKVQGFIRKPEVLARFNSLFSGVAETRNVVFVHYQVKEEENDENAYTRNCAIERVSIYILFCYQIYCVQFL